MSGEADDDSTDVCAVDAEAMEELDGSLGKDEIEEDCER